MRENSVTCLPQNLDGMWLQGSFVVTSTEMLSLPGRCRFFLGSNKVLQVALGKTDAEEYRDGAHKAAEVRLPVMSSLLAPYVAGRSTFEA